MPLCHLSLTPDGRLLRDGNPCDHSPAEFVVHRPEYVPVLDAIIRDLQQQIRDLTAASPRPVPNRDNTIAANAGPTVSVPPPPSKGGRTFVKRLLGHH